ncbi:hypothetical protein C8N28_2517 [Albibacterium bauzanense]|uniref:Uncharacterized protein n=1 Tax=Albibacterium bauzanense TaxID=653929 RepID=A0A4R1LUD1_9SPHI|nr:hypothetical protein C8N28_2517 [Albibacterium bauzanense]
MQYLSAKYLSTTEDLSTNAYSNILLTTKLYLSLSKP